MTKALNKIHILFVPRMYPSENDEFRGIFFKEQAENLAKNEVFDIGVLAVNFLILKKYLSYKNRKTNLLFFEKNGVKTAFKQIFSIPGMYRLNLNLRNKIRLKIFEKYIAKYGKPDVLHLHTFDAGDFAIVVKKKYGINYVVTEHLSGILPETDKYVFFDYLKKTYANSSYNMAVSRNFAGALEKKFNEKFHYLPNFIDADFFSLKPEKKSQKIRFVTVANLIKIKQLDLLIKAFAQAFKDDLNKELIIVGEGSERENLQNLCVQLAVNERITFTGKLDKNQIKNIFHLSDFFVSSSKFESFGIAMVEAMSCGLPVIATKTPGAKSIITDEKVGILTEQNAKSLANALKNTINKNFNPEEIRNYVLENFSYQSVSERLIAIYKNALNIE